jgi:hypothetical protein
MPNVLVATYAKATSASVKHSDVPSTLIVPPAKSAAITSVLLLARPANSTAIADWDIIVIKDHVRRE